MFRIIRTKNLAALRADRDQAHADLAALQAEAAALRTGAERATDSAIRAELLTGELREQLATATAGAARVEGELSALRTQQLLDTEDRAVLRALLRNARKQQLDRVYVLFRNGDLHSVHISPATAEDTAEKEGASSTWTVRETARPSAEPAPWSIGRFPLQRTQD
ncbi:hypothetical protein ACFXKG_18410 [Streptomyces sp. NPDC059255]|uniref:hypothetical protein n=1 Tax=Streptomyces sp. NPDC059255 TaxID=3346793 RepID=UPI0036901A7E